MLTVLNSTVPASFGMIGFIQGATLNPGGAPNAGGTLTINNITMIVPDNSVIQMPAHALTWAQLFAVDQSAPVFDNALPAQATPPINHPATNTLGLPMTGLALTDAPPTPPAAGVFPGVFPSCEVNVVGNIDTTGASGSPAGSYIVALILPIAQELAIDSRNVTRYIHPLIDVGVLVESHHGRNQIWRSPEVLSALDAFAARAGRRIPAL